MSSLQIINSKEENTMTDDEQLEKDLKFFKKEELMAMSKSINLAQRRNNEAMKITRLNHAVKVIVSKMGFQNEEHLKAAERRGDELYGGLYDAYLVAKYQLEATKRKLAEMPQCPTVANMIHIFFYEVQKEDPEFWKEMKERAGARAAKINQYFLDDDNGFVE
jgi:hypothetical protein